MTAERRGEAAQPSLDQLRERIIARGNVPRHVAVIMDGNGRWARIRRLPRVVGHRAGRHSLRRCLRACVDLGVSYLTLYTFSQENFKRPAAEVKALWLFLDEALAAEKRELDRNNVRLVASGEIGMIPGNVRAVLDETIADLADNDGLVLNLALAYGGRTEILRAARALARRAAAGEIDPDDIDEDALRAGFYSPEIPDPDLVIRTSGEQRLSNFLIWQSAYSEIHITKVLWPDFDERDLMTAVEDYQGRDRRFGGVNGNDRSTAPARPKSSLLDPKRWINMLKVRP